ncbi:MULTISPECIES: MFS transporter [Streptosporangium]|uniref:MFS family permease n=1 Tax=Streptosporangium brasiliense TaxID=47480 RepID=A0ABT9RMH3_9ACTN|nr:MFS transporter [Streptosporangium brasiliense]MDP9869510.1 MFS family permease [Streptosporangium brasiliense]
MYLSTTRATGTPAAAGRLRSARVPATVVALGMVSFFTDISAEMVAAFLPMYLLYGLGAGFLHLGLLDGLYTGASALLRLAGGHLADRSARPKAVALAGYGLSAASKLLFPLVGGAVSAIGAAVAVDRAGKGLRAAPRDALITAATSPHALGAAFGVHRALDTAGALLGPVVVFALVAAVGDAYDAVFVTSFCLAMIGVVILACSVRDRRIAPAVRPRVSLRDGWGLLARHPLRRAAAYATMLGLVTAGDAFVFVGVQRQTGLGAATLPLLPLATSLVFLLAAVPLGRLADRAGGWKVFVAGHALLAAAYALLAAEWQGPVAAACVLLLHGLFYAATDGVLMAHLAPHLPEHLRASGLAITQTGQALARTGGTVGFGALATGWDLRVSFVVFAVLLTVGLLPACVFPPDGKETPS